MSSKLSIIIKNTFAINHLKQVNIIVLKSNTPLIIDILIILI